MTDSDAGIAAALLAAHPDDDGCRTTLIDLTQFFAAAGLTPLEADEVSLHAFRAATRERLGKRYRALCETWLPAYYRAACDAGLVPQSLALIAGVSAIDASPDRDRLLGVAAQHGGGTRALKALGTLAEHFGWREQGPTDATPEDIEAFIRVLQRQSRPDTIRARMVWVRRFYRSAFEAGAVQSDVALATGISPVELSADRRVLERFADEHGGDRMCRAAMRAIARYFGDLGSAPLQARIEELDSMVDRLVADLRYTRETLVHYAPWIGEFYGWACAQGLVDPSIAVAGGADALLVSPDATALRRFVETRQETSVLCGTTLRALAGFMARRGTWPTAATPQEVAEFRASLRGHGLEYQSLSRRYRWVREFYAEAFDSGFVDLRVALAAGADPLAVSPDRLLLLAIADRNRWSARRRELARLARYFGERGKGPFDASATEIAGFRAWADATLRGASTQRWSRQMLREAFEAALVAGRVSPAVAKAAGVRVLGKSPEAAQCSAHGSAGSAHRRSPRPELAPRS
jgi:hypothetical protein